MKKKLSLKKDYIQGQNKIRLVKRIMIEHFDLSLFGPSYYIEYETNEQVPMDDNYNKVIKYWETLTLDKVKSNDEYIYDRYSDGFTELSFMKEDLAIDFFKTINKNEILSIDQIKRFFLQETLPKKEVIIS